jgi:hypothetical protein
VVTIENPDGKATGVIARPRSADPNQYGFGYLYEKPGIYKVRIFPPETTSTCVSDTRNGIGSARATLPSPAARFFFGEVDLARVLLALAEDAEPIGREHLALVLHRDQQLLVDADVLALERHVGEQRCLIALVRELLERGKSCWRPPLIS